jgi:hypothetical protein
MRCPKVADRLKGRQEPGGVHHVNRSNSLRPGPLRKVITTNRSARAAIAISRSRFAYAASSTTYGGSTVNRPVCEMSTTFAPCAASWSRSSCVYGGPSGPGPRKSGPSSSGYTCLWIMLAPPSFTPVFYGATLSAAPPGDDWIWT